MIGYKPGWTLPVRDHLRMWQKRTDQEITEARKKASRTRLGGAALLGVFFAVLITFTRSRFKRVDGSSSLFSWDEIPGRLPFAIVFGLLATWIIYRWRLFSKQTMICPLCDKSKFDDGVKRCSCGGDFVEIETVKWDDHAS